MVHTDQALHHFLHRKDGIHPAGAVHPAMFRREAYPVRRKNNHRSCLFCEKTAHLVSSVSFQIR